MRITRRRFLTGRSSGGASASEQPDCPASPLRPAILKGCLAYNGITCRTCAEACDHGTMRFQVKHGGIALPHVLFELCTGCGVCADVCPVQSIAMHLPDESAAI